MSLTYAYSLDNGSGAPVANDFGITSAVPALGDMFIVSANLATTKAIATTANTNKVAVSVGQNFRGLASGGTYAATTVGLYQPSALTKLIMDASAVYRIPWSASGASATVGTAYNLANTLVTQDQTLSPSAVNTSYVNFILVENDTTPTGDAPFGYAFVTIPTAYRVIPA
jgi:hypothetical protein